MRVLIAGELESFLIGTDVPPDIEVELLPPGAPVPEGDYVGLVPLLTRSVGAAEMDRLPALRVVANYAVGYDNIDVAEARVRRIAVANTPDILTRATGELTWTLILAVARRVHEGERMVRGGRWPGWHPTQLLGMGLEDKVLGILGAGRIGRDVARRAPAFGMRVAYWDRNTRPELETELDAERLPLDELLGVADVVSVHLPLTSGTERLIDAAALERMRSSAILVNTSRGGVVDEDALVRALQAGGLRGAGLDVYQREPAVHPGLVDRPDVVLLPHLGSATEEARTGMWRIAWENLLRGARQEPLLTPVR